MALVVKKTKTLNLATLNAVTDFPDDFAECTTFTVEARMASGSFGTAVLSFECSNVGTIYVPITKRDLATAVTFTAAGFFGDIEPFAAELCRIRVSTSDGAAGTVSIKIVGKG